MSQGRNTSRIDLTLELEHFLLRVDVVLGQGLTGLFGASGAGKSSLLELIAGIRRGAIGSILINDQPWLDSARGSSLPIERRDLGYVPQDGLLFPHLTVEGNLRTAHSRRQRRVDAERLERIVDLLGVEPLRHRAVDHLSGGERQRVALARALCAAPRLLLLDEPLAAVDIVERRRLLPLLRKLCQELELPTLYISHDPIDMQILCDELLVLEAGRVIAQGDPATVLLDPRVLPLAVEMGYRNVFDGRLVAIDGDTERLRLRPAGADRGQPAVELIAPRSGGEPGDAVTLTLAAAEIIVADHAPNGLSARNVLEATVVDIASSARLRWVHCRMRGGPTVVVELTAAACQQLELGTGRTVWLVIKTRSCRVTPM